MRIYFKLKREVVFNKLHLKLSCFQDLLLCISLSLVIKKLLLNVNLFLIDLFYRAKILVLFHQV